MFHLTCSTALLSVACALAQPATDRLRFEVASIKPAEPLPPMVAAAKGMARAVRTGMVGGPGSSDPGRMTFTYSTVKSMLVAAYGVRQYQVDGPAWIDSERYDIVAKVPEGTTKEQCRVMLQNLLKDRFKLEVKQEQRELPVYALTVAKGGPKLKPAAEDDPPPPAPLKPGETPPPPPGMSSGAMRAMMSEGVPRFPTGLRSGSSMMMMSGAKMTMVIRAAPMKQLADAITSQLNRPVTDETGLDGKYDVILTFERENGGTMGMSGPVTGGMSGGDSAAGANEVPQAQEPVPPLPAALQQQLGLKLESKKGMVDMVVVLSGEKTPTEN